MKTKFYPIVLFSIFLFISCQNQKTEPGAQELGPSGAGQSLDFWSFSRAYPDSFIPEKYFEKAFYEKKIAEASRNPIFDEEWESMGPKNIGGRTLDIAFHPDNPDMIFAGSASGGLWKTTTAGEGVSAWERVPTGFPVLGVSAIAIDPNDGNVMYIGTGEVYGSLAASPGIINRVTRGTYGIGILKSEDGGITWEKSLDWNLQDLTGVAEIEINPINSNTVYAATRSGLYISYDAGEEWTAMGTFPFAVDLEINPMDTNIIVATFGNVFHPFSGIYRSTDAGNTFEIIPSLPAGYTGKAMLCASPSNPNILYASIFDLFNSNANPDLGLHRSDDGGVTWNLVNDTDVATFQGWYSHDVAIKPDDEDSFIWAGIDVHKSIDAGVSLEKKTVWQNWFMGQVPVGGPEGPPNYVHADIHKVTYHPTDPETVFAVTDGGLFVSFDNGENWEGRNGGYQAQQFYANFSNSTTDSLFAIGGMQDNSTAVFTGDDAWTRHIGGDGMSTAIDPTNDSVMYASVQFLRLFRSSDRGMNFTTLPEPAASEFKAFNGPYELAPSNPEIIYAGAQHLYKSLDSGNNWEATSSAPIDGSNGILAIGLSPQNENLIYVSSVPDPFDFTNNELPKIMVSADGGTTWDSIPALPDRVASDIVVHPENEDIVYISYLGFGVSHLWKTEDGGVNWFASDSGLPDVPTNSILIDPVNPNHIYVGNDLGVYASIDDGQTWEPYSSELPEAALAMHLSYSPSNRKIWVATHGNGVYQADMIEPPISHTDEPAAEVFLEKINYFPNPASQYLTIQYELKRQANVSLHLLDAEGKSLRVFSPPQIASGNQEIKLNISDLAAGIYYFNLEGTSGKSRFNESRMFLKTE